jgi:type VI secretion system secreted protein Hcp
MAVDMFLKLDGIPGESTDDKHKGEIDIDSYSFGVSQLGVSGSGGGGAGKASLQDIHFSAPVTVASPALFLACASGKHIATGTLTVRKAGGEQASEFLKINMTDILISGYSSGTNPLDNGFSLRRGDDAEPVDQFSLNFHKVNLLYTAQRADGSVGVTGVGGVDVQVQ